MNQPQSQSQWSFFESLFEALAIVSIAVAVLLLLLGPFIYGSWYGDSELLLVLALVATLQAIYLERKA